LCLGIKASERGKVQEEWMAGKYAVITATVSFGMGVDKSTVRLVFYCENHTDFNNHSFMYQFISMIKGLLHNCWKNKHCIFIDILYLSLYYKTMYQVYNLKLISSQILLLLMNTLVIL
jgi:hypothetical protein